MEKTLLEILRENDPEMKDMMKTIDNCECVGELIEILLSVREAKYKFDMIETYILQILVERSQSHENSNDRKLQKL